jgi:hypothetical protein
MHELWGHNASDFLGLDLYEQLDFLMQRRDWLFQKQAELEKERMALVTRQTVMELQRHLRLREGTISLKPQLP